MNDLTTSDCGTKSLPGNVCSRCPHMSKPPTLNAKSILPYTGNNELRCYEAKIEESEKAAAARSRTQDTSGLSHQCSATEQ